MTASAIKVANKIKMCVRSPRFKRIPWLGAAAWLGVCLLSSASAVAATVAQNQQDQGHSHHAHHGHHHQDSETLARLFFTSVMERRFYLPGQSEDETPGASPDSSFDAASGRDQEKLFVRLPDRSTYNLDSGFYRALEKMAADLPPGSCDRDEHGRGHGHSFFCFLREVTSQEFIRNQTPGAVELFWRYGPMATLVIAALEYVEHGILSLPPTFCLITQSACILTASQIKEQWNSFRYAYPQNQNILVRTWTGLKLLKARFVFLRAMRLVFPGPVAKGLFAKHAAEGNSAEDLFLSTPLWPALLKKISRFAGSSGDGGGETAKTLCDHGPLHGGGLDRFFCEHDQKADDGFRAEAVSPNDRNHRHDHGHFAQELETPSEPIALDEFLKPIDGEVSPIVRLFSAEEQLAFLDLYIRLGNAAIARSTVGHKRLLVSLSLANAKMGLALDQYGYILRQMSTVRAFDPKSLEANKEVIRYFLTQFLSYQVEMVRFLQAVENGSMPLDSLVFKIPSRLKRDLKFYQRKGRLRPQSQVDARSGPCSTWLAEVSPAE